jgi:AcrR family transcriptional regulator
MGRLCEIHFADLQAKWKNRAMPRISTTSLAQHRDWRRNQLIEAAAAIALESGGEAVTVAAVAQRAGLSRTSVYEYFASGADLIADLIIDELDSFSLILEEAIAGITEPSDAIECWISTSLKYVADGRHLLAKALNSTQLPQERSTAIGAAHRRLLASLTQNLQVLGVRDIHQALSLIQAATDVATKRIESGNDAESEISMTSRFCIAGIRGLI